MIDLQPELVLIDPSNRGARNFKRRAVFFQRNPDG